MCITFVSQRINEFVKVMEQTSYNIKAELPDLLDHSRKILGLYKPQLDFCLSVHLFKKYTSDGLLLDITQQMMPLFSLKWAKPVYTRGLYYDGSLIYSDLTWCYQGKSRLMNWLPKLVLNGSTRVNKMFVCWSGVNLFGTCAWSLATQAIFFPNKSCSVFSTEECLMMSGYEEFKETLTAKSNTMSVNKTSVFYFVLQTYLQYEWDVRFNDVLGQL